MDFVDYYKILGIDKTATEKDVKSAYRKLARKYHPDLNPNNKDANKNFQQINEANEVLSDPVKRKKYDQYGKDWQHAEEFEKAKQGQSSNSRGTGYSGAQSGGDFSDFFESMFGGAAFTGRSGGGDALKRFVQDADDPFLFGERRNFDNLGIDFIPVDTRLHALRKARQI